MELVGPGKDRIGGATRLVPATHSLLSSEALLYEVARTYPMYPVDSCRLLKTSLNDTYLLTAPNGRYVLRVYGAHWRTSSGISFELELLGHLAAKGVRVSAPLPTIDGGATGTLRAPEGVRQYALFAHTGGVAMSWEGPDQCFLAGHLLGTVHAAADGFISQHARSPLDLAALIDRPLEAVCPFLAHRPDDCAYLEVLAARLRALAEANIAAGLDWGVCHGDYGAKNVHVDQDGRPTVLDFDLCGFGWRAYDFSPIFRTARTAQDYTLWEAFLRGYREVRALSASDLAAVPLFRALRHLAMLGLFASNVAEWGTARLSDRCLNGLINFFRSWEMEYLVDR